MTNNIKEQIEDLKALVSDETLSLASRKVAAEHLVDLLVSAVPEPSDDHEEVTELRTPWKSDDEALNEIYASGWRVRNEVFKWSATGPTLAQARKHVHERIKLRTLLAVVVDLSAHRLVRLAACRAILDDYLSPMNKFNRNGYDETRLLDAILPSTAKKWTSSGEIQVERPPRTLADVW